MKEASDNRIVKRCVTLVSLISGGNHVLRGFGHSHKAHHDYVLNDNGKVHQRCTVRQVDHRMQFLNRLPDRFRVCYEASTGYGQYIELLTTVAERVVVAHPGLLKLIFRSPSKYDRRDAEKLAKLLSVDQVTAVHVPSADIRAWRELTHKTP